ncbi:aldehyde dehydrogenase family protein [Microbacterium sp. NPDC077644]|uniref:aldehyde dehydrogenase family protein n=1 Tax=Microbacterium sp. NPDC077644 TaxID=3155055 RepID=UPI00344BCD40
MTTPGSPGTELSAHLRFGGIVLDQGSGGSYDHIDPATGHLNAVVPLGGREEIDRAAKSAAAAFVEWSSWAPTARREALLRLSQLITEHEDEFVTIAARENGTPVATGPRLCEIARDWIGYYAGWADKLEGQVSRSFASGGELTYSQPEPFGVIGVIITWNVPLISLCMKAVPALAAGNTVLIKPSELTPFTPDLFARLCVEAGIPEGVVNCVPGNAEAGDALVAHPLVQKITFTGGPATARKIMATCAANLKPSVMELGGKSASVIFPDADLDIAAKNTVYLGLGALSGQGCLIGSRVLVHESVYDEVVAKLIATAEQLTIGNPTDPATRFGPVINSVACERILGIVERAARDGAHIALGGERLGGEFAGGSYVAPTIVTGVDPTSELAQTELFGPVLSVIRFSEEDEALEIANGTAFGLAAYLHTRDITRALRMVDKLEAGSVYVNGAKTTPAHSPFGGRGESGFGREGGRVGIDEFVRPKTVSIASLA